MGRRVLERRRDLSADARCAARPRRRQGSRAGELRALRPLRAHRAVGDRGSVDHRVRHRGGARLRARVQAAARRAARVGHRADRARHADRPRPAGQGLSADRGDRARADRDDGVLLRRTGRDHAAELACGRGRARARRSGARPQGRDRARARHRRRDDHAAQPVSAFVGRADAARRRRHARRDPRHARARARRHLRVAVRRDARQRGDPDRRGRRVSCDRQDRRRRHRTGVPADRADRRRRGRAAVRHRAARVGAKFDADRHDRRPGDHGRLPAHEDSVLPAPADHARARARAGADRRAVARRQLGRAAAGMEPGAAEPAAAVRDVAADPLGQRSPDDGRAYDRPRNAGRRVGAVRRDHRHEPAADHRRRGLIQPVTR
ncbi:Mn2+ and Fe2+ transporter [Burkholderia dolosa AU0158]|nr:Mn2+ and Fe2+ transporter [Burkholderia dolosa AU0158]